MVPIFLGGTGLYLDSLKGTMSHIPKIPKKIELKIKLLHSKLGNLHFYNKTYFLHILLFQKKLLIKKLMNQ